MTQLGDQELQDIQGIIARFSKDHQELVFVQFGSAAAGQRLLGNLAPCVSNAWEVRGFNQLFSEIVARSSTEHVVEATWIGLGISAHGYNALGVNLQQELGTTDEGLLAFCAGMVARSAEQIEDAGIDTPSNWLEPFQQGNLDAMIVVASDTRENLDRTVDQVTGSIQDAGAIAIYQERGATLPPPLTGHEHFGFKDGVSQPNIDGFDTPPAPGEPGPLEPGEFILGYPDNSGNTATAGNLWTHGTFGVFRRLHQDVAGFAAQAAAMDAQTSPTLATEQVSADLVGRWPSGSPLALDPGTDPGDSGISNAFDYSDDSPGENTPRFGHIRKVNPRNEDRPDQTTDPAQNHRMIRVGIPYGPPLAPGAADDGAQRGLHFIALMADLDQQFEFVQRQWVTNPNFPNGQVQPTPGSAYTPPQPGTPADGCDPVIGSHNAGDQISLNQSGTIHALSLLAETVTVTGGEYFFFPSLSAIGLLAGGTTASTPPPSTG
jgi:Dyp-type peroxidase family